LGHQIVLGVEDNGSSYTTFIIHTAQVSSTGEHTMN